MTELVAGRDGRRHEARRMWIDVSPEVEVVMQGSSADPNDLSLRLVAESLRVHRAFNQPGHK